MAKRVQTIPKEFYILTAITTALFVSRNTIDPIFPLYITELGASTFELGLIVSLFSFTAIISKIPIGFLAEKVGKWPIIPIGLFGQTVCFFLYSIAPNPQWIYPIRIFHAIILAAFIPVVLAIIADISPPSKRGDSLGRFLTSFGLAMIFGPFLSSILLNYVNFRQLFRLIATLPLIAGGIFLLAKNKGVYTVYSLENRVHDETPSRSLYSLKTYIFSRNIMILLIIRVSYSFTYAFFATFFAVYASESLFYTSSLIAILFGINGVANTLMRVPSGRLADRIGSKIPIIIAFSLAALANVIISETKAIYTIVLGVTIYGMSHGIRSVAEWALFADSTPTEFRATASTYVSTMYDFGTALGAVVAGTLSLILPIPMLFNIAAGILILPIIVSATIIQKV